MVDPGFAPVPHCRHGRVLLACGDGSCPEQDALLAADLLEELLVICDLLLVPGADVPADVAGRLGAVRRILAGPNGSDRV